MTSPLCIANIGAEEDADPGLPAVRAVSALWRSLFDDPPALDLLPSGEVATAWLNTAAAQQEAEAAGRRLVGAPPTCVARVHDKAFAQEVAAQEGLVPACLAGLSVAFSPEALRAPDALDQLGRCVAEWPAWARERFTLKPRWGSSGRGRVAGTAGNVDTAEIRGALARLATRGGAQLEPWLERTADLSACYWIAPNEGLRLVGTTDQWTAPSGLYRGARGTVDSRGRVCSASRHDEAAREGGLALATAAAELGYTGPLGVDFFAFHTPDGDTALRVSEVNARYTVGLVTVGLVRRALPRLRSELSLEPGRLVHFALCLSGDHAAAADVVALRPASELADDGPALLFAKHAEALESALDGGE